MSSFIKDFWKPRYWKEIVVVKIPRHWLRMKRRMSHGDSLAEATADEIVDEYKEGPGNWG